MIVVSWNGQHLLPECLTSLLTQTHEAIEVLLVDNGSADGSVEETRRRFPSVKVICNTQNVGVAAAWNIGVNLVQGETVCFVNQDLVAASDWVSQIRRGIESCGRRVVLGSKLLYPDEKRIIQHAGGTVVFPTGITEHRGQGLPDVGQFDDPIEVDYVTGAAFATTRDVLEDVGGFDERFFPAYFEDVDFCLNAKELGCRVVYWPTAVAFHRESASLGRGSEAFFRAYHMNRLQLVRKHVAATSQLGTFLSRELEWIHSQAGRSAAELRGLRWAYDHGEELFTPNPSHQYREMFTVLRTALSANNE